MSPRPGTAGPAVDSEAQGMRIAVLPRLRVMASRAPPCPRLLHPADVSSSRRSAAPRRPTSGSGGGADRRAWPAPKCRSGVTARSRGSPGRCKAAMVPAARRRRTARRSRPDIARVGLAGCRTGWGRIDFRALQADPCFAIATPRHDTCCSAIAQLVEQVTVNHRVVGSSPTRGATAFRTPRRAGAAEARRKCDTDVWPRERLAFRATDQATSSSLSRPILLRRSMNFGFRSCAVRIEARRRLNSSCLPASTASA